MTSPPQINVTPLIDVLLVLLIIFMVISPGRPNRFEVRAPEKLNDPGAAHGDLNLLLTVTRDGRYFLNRAEARTPADLEALLHYALDGRPADRKAVFIKAPRTIPYGQVIGVIDLMKSAGCSPIGLQIEDL